MTAEERAKKWLEGPLSDSEKQTLEGWLKDGSEQLEDAFYKDLEFGTGGMRGVMGLGSNRINRYTLGLATQGLSNYLNTQFPKQTPKVAIAYDCRHNSDSFAKLVADVLTANGIVAYLFPALRPTPELSFVVRHLKCQGGIVITASHNPPKYNGYKVYWEDGAQIVAPHDRGIIDEVKKLSSINEVKFNGNEKLLHLLDAGIDKAFIQASLDQRKPGNKSSISIVFTSLHGTSITIMPELLARANYREVHLVEEQSHPDGDFSTVASPNPEEREALQMALDKAEQVGADMVVGTDPDSDRLGVAIRDDRGEMMLLNGNQCGVLLTDYLLRKSNLNGNEFIAYTIVSSELFGDVARSYGVEASICLTGFKHIAALIREAEGSKTFIGGGEESYGFMIGDFVRDKDALTSTLIFCDLVAEAKAEGKSAFDLLMDIYRKHGVYDEQLISITKEGPSGAAEIAAMMERLRNNPPSSLGGEKVVRIDDVKSGHSRNVKEGSTETLNLPSSNVLQFYTENGSKISARPSGTEPKIKFYCSVRANWKDGVSYKEQQKILQQSAKQMMEDLGVL